MQPALKTTLMTAGILGAADNNLAPLIEVDRLGQADSNHGPSQNHQTAHITEEVSGNIDTESCQ
jgi:hypothetical protein